MSYKELTPTEYQRERRKDPAARERDREMQRATGRALGRLRRLHYAEYYAMYAEELSKIRTP